MKKLLLLLFALPLFLVSCSDDEKDDKHYVDSVDKYYVKYYISGVTHANKYVSYPISITYSTPEGDKSAISLGEYVAGPFTQGATVTLFVKQTKWHAYENAKFPYGKISISKNGMPYVDVMEQRENGGFTMSYTID